MSAAPAASLDSIGVPQPLRERAKILWIITALGGLWGWIICAFIWKEEGQDQDAWFQQQLGQSFYVGCVSWIGSVFCGLGWFVGAILGLLGFLAIGRGEDYLAPVIGDLAAKDPVGIGKTQASSTPVVQAPPTSPQAAPDLSPVDGITLEHWAWGQAQLAQGGTVDNVIGYLQVDRARWDRAHAEWTNRMANDASGTIAAACARYGGAS
ncbi:MAG: hypothetical protein JXB39_00065 [Deltaproteobacteria bacterium]|nr:hypothetical protein [Deltaproteobacteria bacterium]